MAKDSPKRFKNKARCRRCGDVITSRHVHDYKTCDCGAIFVDGGNDYWRAGGELQFFERILEPLRSKPKAP